MDAGLIFQQHLNNWLKNAFGSFEFIYPNRYSLNVKIKNIICESLVLLKFNFYNGPSLIQNINIKYKEFKKNSCLRLIYGVHCHKKCLTSCLMPNG